jgi:type VI secretion system secreted protein VgrG
VNDYRLTATNITKIAMENMNLQAKEIEKNAEQINIESSKEEMQISAGKSVNIKSGEKSKLF